jgi:hypothetical protein
MGQMAGMPVAVAAQGVDEGLAESNPTGDESEPGTGKGGQEIGTRQEENEVTELAAAGDYAVVAGTFANHENAVRRASLLVEMGYAGANIVRQATNGLYAVWVNTFTEKAEASVLVRKLAHQQLSAYVLRR